MKAYFEPEMEIVRFNSVEILASSGITTTTKDYEDEGNYSGYYPPKPRQP